MTIYENPKLGKIRSAKVNGIAWFVARDVAMAAGYSCSNVRAELDRRVSDENAWTYNDNDGKPYPRILSSRGNQPCFPTLITDKGVREMIEKRKVPPTRGFKTWFFDKVVPSVMNEKEAERFLPLEPAPFIKPESVPVDEPPVETLPEPVPDAQGSPVTDDVPQRQLTPDDYIQAAKIVSTCRNERLPYVLELLRQSGMDLTAVKANVAE